MLSNKISPITRFIFERTKSLNNLTLKMAKSSYEYVKKFELDDTILPNTWIVIRLDDTNLYNRRASKLLTTINSKFSTSYVFYWNKFFEKESLKYPPTFDGRIVIYPSDENIIDYLKWRQADVHINNLYNTTFWALVQQGNLTPVLAEKRLCGTVSSDKNEILFKEFNINYNNELPIYKRGTLMLRKNVSNEDENKYANVIVDVHDDMLKDNYWKDHSTLLLPNCKNSISHNGPLTDLIKEQIIAKNKLKNNNQNKK
ncbi:probable tRNA(His) guanylyltransferase isoform X2 [Aricia agestis]|uniref:probable tRNA(His) guanylyltransferase isoform X2 n=1 Tax=Aricia agestis TaxID=91739 RepID=UPI001C20B716|nr:probable tRNA(His) guanylyltransferase isoform X2 [Aricia agestis]